MLWITWGAAFLAALCVYLWLVPAGEPILPAPAKKPKKVKTGRPGQAAEYLELARDVMGISGARMRTYTLAAVAAVGALWALLTAGDWSSILAGLLLGPGVAGLTVELLASGKLQKLDRMSLAYQSTVTGALLAGMTVPKALEAADRTLAPEAKEYLGGVATSRKAAVTLADAAEKLHSNSLSLFARLIGMSLDKGVAPACFARHEGKQRDEEQIRTEAALDVSMYLWLYAIFLLGPPVAFVFDRLAEPAWFSALVVHLKWWIWLTVPLEAFVLSGLRKFSRIKVGLGRING